VLSSAIDGRQDDKTMAFDAVTLSHDALDCSAIVAQLDVDWAAATLDVRRPPLRALKFWSTRAM
jgi:hypothetical protein